MKASAVLIGLVSLCASAVASSEKGAEKVLNYTLRTEPPQLNSMKASDMISFFVIDLKAKQ